ncbi:MAG: molecular chaperone DnaJ [Vicinamibacterales bacterium]
MQHQDPRTESNPSCLPALIDELDRVRFAVEIARGDRLVDELRARITAEEASQRLVQLQIDDRIGMLRRDHERISAEIGRLEGRLERLVFARRALSDHELDDEEHVERAEEAAFWAEWRQQREERRGTVINRRPAGDEDITLRQLFRALARLIHPDLAIDSGDRNRREAVMRLANAAHEARDIEQLNRLLEIWSKPQEGSDIRDIGTLRARVAEREVKRNELSRQLQALENGALGKMIRRPKAELTRYIKREEERLRREIATLRLKRRRLLTAVEDRRRELAEASD